ncbi:hypothetical protein KZO37_08900 [Rhodococcus fascians]|uniref:hypothetical protein n=1 Tax=Nocardiaceae TaxID=85025 RepID=UPI0007AADB31|nr:MULTISPECIES: hypothetical protein [Rhodococcus]AMY53446.1 hypothetical protein A3L23_02104 [Rhodococcus fascians D188]MBW4779482.1 hypothetical protein [Rhodococcus fascians]MBY4205816.1 hypothetical protein [Rhodococcus fascians]MDJ0002031.1 hypothetical protein [Rhodococcus fascians]
MYETDVDQDLFGAVDTEEVDETACLEAYFAVLERSIEEHLARTGEGTDRVRSLTLRDIRGERHTTALLRRRSALGLSICPNSRVFVDESGKPMMPDDRRGLRLSSGQSTLSTP